jgi:uncharacterized protein involved in exopolysaccharide biosynthesis
MAENKNRYKFDSVDLILYLWNKRIPLLILTGIAAVVSIIVSLTIDEKYKSEVILFPAASGSVSQDLLSSSYSEKSILKLGEDEEVEQLLQILNSDDIRDRIIEEYDLMNHYEIDSRYPMTTLYKTYSENINFVPTKFMSVKISVMDEDPHIAAKIANKISDLTDTIFYEMQVIKATEAVKLVEKEYNAFQDEIESIEDSLTIIRSYGVVNYNAQAERYVEAYGNALIEKNFDAARKLDEKLKILAKFGGTYNSLRMRQDVLQKQIGILKVKYSEAVLDATQKLSKKYVVNKATVAEKKSYPIRWLIVVVSTFSAFILSLIFIVINDAVQKRVNEIKKKL